MKYEDTPWINLVEAVVVRALIDHHDAINALSRCPYNRKAQEMKEDVEKFFESETFEIFCDFDESVLYMAQKEGFAHER